MSNQVKIKRLSQAMLHFNVGQDEISQALKASGFDIDGSNVNLVLSKEMLDALYLKFSGFLEDKDLANLNVNSETKDTLEPTIEIKEAPPTKEPKEPEPIVVDKTEENLQEPKKEEPEKISSSYKIETPVIKGKLDLDKVNPKSKSKETKKSSPSNDIIIEAPVEVKTEENPQTEDLLIEAETTPEPSLPSEELNVAASENSVDQIEHVETKFVKLEGNKVLGTIDIDAINQREKKVQENLKQSKRTRIQKGKETKDASKQVFKFNNQDQKKIVEKKKKDPKDAKEKTKQEIEQGVSAKVIEETIKNTQAKLNSAISVSKRQKIRKQKREEIHEKIKANELDENEKILKISEFITLNDLASLMNMPANQIIAYCFSMGIITTINQRLDAEIIELIASEFDYELEFIAIEDNSHFEDDEDNQEDYEKRAPIVTIMGHVDHGKTSLLDYIRNTNVVNKEAGGITQHIGAYDVYVPSQDRKITFIDTPGHEAFTAMRARGAKLTDIAVIVIAADDKVMPQTKEAINHAQSASVPMVFALNKIDKDGANPDGVRTQLSEMNILVESWGGKHQEQEISAKKGIGIEELLEKILLEADLLELKANPKKLATGVLIEASLDKGRGYIATLLVTAGTLKVGDFIVCGSHFGKVKAMSNYLGQKLDEVKPGEPVQIIGLNGAPSAGEQFKQFTNESEAKSVANKRAQILREQGIRTKKHITLEEIGRRLALGTFKELNIIIKGDVDGSIQALSDSLDKLSNEEVQVNIIHTAVGAISESDIMLASASDAIVIGFNVRPSTQAKALAEKETIDIRQYSIIYQAIEEIKSAIEGMLEPSMEEKNTGVLEVREIFKIPKIGNIAGSFCNEGKIFKASKVRLIRDGIVIFSGELSSLKRFKDDVKEVVAGQDCGVSIKNYDDIQVGDVIEAYEEISIKRTI
ncbi:MAG: translation initiation factor IF-2 [Chitinophagales bacterium]|nr:translation initiation factor IF-2 [Chitinophagales bacterium]